jgi:regulator of protease activity HflC (stomatin/prohibitin superfamily)
MISGIHPRRIIICIRSNVAVKPGEKAIIFNRFSGVKNTITSEGTHLLLPFVEWPIIMDVRTRPRAIKSTTGTRGEWDGTLANGKVSTA